MLNEKLDFIRKLKGKKYVGHIVAWVKTFDNGKQVIQGILNRKDDTEAHRLREGEILNTSEIVQFHEDETVVETKNSFYTLGKKLEVKDDED